MKKYSELTKKYILKNWKRSIITILTITLSMAIMISFTMIYSAQEKDAQENAKAKLGYYDVVFEGLDINQYYKLNSDDRIKSNYATRKEGALILSSEKSSVIDSYNFIRLTPEAYENLFDFELMQGRMPEKSNEILLNYGAANSMGVPVNIGDEIDFELYPNAKVVTDKYIRAASNGNEIGGLIESVDLEKSINEKSNVKYKVVGIIENMAQQNNIYGFISEDELYENNKIDVFSTLSNPKFIWGGWGYGDEKDIAEELGIRFLMRYGTSGEGNIGSQVKYIDYSALETEDNKIVTGNSTLIILIVIAFMFATIYNIFNISVYERIRHIGTLKALGATRKQINRIVLGEANIYALIGMTLGAILGYGCTKLLFIPVATFMNVDMSSFPLDLGISEIIKTIFLVYIMVMISANSGIKKQVRMTPVEAMNSVSGSKKSNIDMVGHNKFIEGKGKIESKLAYRNLYRNISRNNMCTLVISMSMILFIFFGSMFLNGLNNIDVSLPSNNWQIELRRLDIPESFKPLSEDTRNKLENINGVEKVYISSSLNFGIPVKQDKVGGLLNSLYERDKTYLKINREVKDYYLTNGYIRIIDKESLPIYKEYLVDGNIDYGELSENGILLVNSGSKRYIAAKTPFDIVYQFETSNKMLEVKVGDKLGIPKEQYPLNIYPGSEANIEINEDSFANLTISGILDKDALRDNCNEYDEKEISSDFKVIMTRECYEKNFEKISNETVLLKLNEERNYNEIVSDIKEIADKELYNVKDYNKIKEAEEKRVNENMAIQLMFLISLVTIVIINIANTFYASIIMRKKELAAIRAVGMSMKQMKKMILTEVFIMATESSIWAVLIGGIPTIWKEMQLQKVGLSNINLLIIILIMSVLIILILTFTSTISAVKKLDTLSIVDDLRADE